MSEPVIIVGAGLAGLAAAIRLAELGQPPRLLEARHEARFPNNTRFSGGVFQIAFHSVRGDPAALARIIATSTGGFVTDALAGAFAGAASRSIAWLEAQGARFGRIEPTEGWRDHVLLPLGYHDKPGLVWEDSGADRLMQGLEARLAALGTTIERGVRARAITLQDGAVAGLHATDPHGQDISLPAAAVIVADGGFQGSPALLRRFVTPWPERFCQRGPGTSPGDGILMAETAGADLVGMQTFYGHLLSADAVRNVDLWPFPFIDFLAAAGILVDRQATRFVDEGRGGVFMANATARHAAADPAMAIFDQPIWEEAGRVFFAPPNPFLPRSGGTLHSAPTLRALAELGGLDPDALEASVRRHNAGEPDRTDPKSTRRPIASPPFYAAPCCVGITHTMGGIRIDTQARVLRPDGSPIAGLYAAGNAAGGLEGGDRRIYIGGLAKALIFGLLAAEHIHHETKV